jgi:hypothetical protein
MEIEFAPTPLPAPSMSTDARLTPSRKRNHEGHIVDYSSPSVPSHQQSSPHTRSHSPTVSQDLSPPSTPLTELGPTPTISPEKQEEADMGSSKPKMTFAEKQLDKAIKQAEKEQKAKEKAEAKAKKEQEKKRKEEEREAARRAKDDKKREKEAAKEADKQKKEAEALKKERVSSKLVHSLQFDTDHAAGSDADRCLLWEANSRLYAAST